MLKVYGKLIRDLIERVVEFDIWKKCSLIWF